MNAFLNDLWQNQRGLLLSSVGFFALFLILAIVSLFDSTQILGINRWIKPMKFSSSIAIYLATLAVYLNFLRGYQKTARIIGLSVVALMTGEMLLILVQAARGTTSHFNVSNPLDGAIFGAMGFMILVNTFLVVYLTYLYFRAEIDLPNAVIWGMRLGLILFLIGSIQGGYMSSQTGHSVGAADGGAGLPFVNWSTVVGDLRVAHFIGLHSIQAIPLVALLFVFLQKRFSRIRPTAFTMVFAIFYLALFSFAFGQALLGKPLLGREIIIGKETLHLDGKNQNALIEKTRFQTQSEND